MRRDLLLLSCEHGGNRVPPAYRPWFAGRRARRALRSHRGFDPGALALARGLAKCLGAPLREATTSRLLVELNRSPGHPRLFSEFTRELSREDRGRLLARHYHPHRRRVERDIRRLQSRGRPVVHVAVHTFTPRWNGRARTADIGLLYDPGRGFERAVCAAWKEAIVRLAPALRVRRNYPYRGVSDGLVTFLRTCFGTGRYAAVELEVSQALVATTRARRRRAIRLLAASLAEVLGRRG